MRITHPHHPLCGQVVEVLRSYHRELGESQVGIQLPDGTRVFISASWVEPLTGIETADPAVLEAPRPLVNAATLLSLAKLVGALKAHPVEERSRSHGAQTISGRDDS